MSNSKICNLLCWCMETQQDYRFTCSCCLDFPVFFCFLIPNLLYNHDMLPVSYYLGFFCSPHLCKVHRFDRRASTRSAWYWDCGQEQKKPAGFFFMCMHVCVSMWVLPECQPSQHKRDYGKKYYETVRIVEWDMKRWWQHGEKYTYYTPSMKSDHFRTLWLIFLLTHLLYCLYLCVIQRAYGRLTTSLFTMPRISHPPSKKGVNTNPFEEFTQT